jgi:hypothetical protein
MLIKNKLNKFLISLLGIFLLAIVILLIKMSGDNKKLEKLANALADNPRDQKIAQIQSQIINTREKTLSKIAHAPGSKSTAAATTETVIPGKVITKKVPVTSSSSSSSSKSSKTTATS